MRWRRLAWLNAGLSLATLPFEYAIGTRSPHHWELPIIGTGAALATLLRAVLLTIRPD